MKFKDIDNPDGEQDNDEGSSVPSTESQNTDQDTGGQEVGSQDADTPSTEPDKNNSPTARVRVTSVSLASWTSADAVSSP